MPQPMFLKSPQGRQIAYRLTQGRGPCVVFLGGFKSDMEGTKALHLQAWADAEGRSFLRFDYSGHGASGGDFLDGAIGDWFEDAVAAVGLTTGPVVLVGSSMGGLDRAVAGPDHGGTGGGACGYCSSPGFYRGFNVGVVFRRSAGDAAA